jgi:hypothetical protein
VVSIYVVERIVVSALSLQALEYFLVINVVEELVPGIKVIAHVELMLQILRVPAFA